VAKSETTLLNTKVTLLNSLKINFHSSWLFSTDVCKAHHLLAGFGTASLESTVEMLAEDIDTLVRSQQVQQISDLGPLIYIFSVLKDIIVSILGRKRFWIGP
jgi:hypothetical protein